MEIKRELDARKIKKSVIVAVGIHVLICWALKYFIYKNSNIQLPSKLSETDFAIII